MIDNRSPPDGNPHANPEAYFERYPVPDRHERNTLRSLAELGDEADELIEDTPKHTSEPSEAYLRDLAKSDPSDLFKGKSIDPPSLETRKTDPAPAPEPTPLPSPPRLPTRDDGLLEPTALERYLGDLRGTQLAQGALLEKLAVTVDSIHATQLHKTQREVELDHRVTKLERNVEAFRKAAE